PGIGDIPEGLLDILSAEVIEPEYPDCLQTDGDEKEKSPGDLCFCQKEATEGGQRNKGECQGGQLDSPQDGYFQIADGQTDQPIHFRPFMCGMHKAEAGERR